MARLETDLIRAQAIADHVAERLALEDIAVSLADAGGGRWRVAIHFHSEAERKPCGRRWPRRRAPRPRQRCNSAGSKRPIGSGKASAGLAPVEAGRFIVHGAHDRARVANNRIGIEIEAALAFGTGHHGTTRGCLLALDAIGKVSSRQRRPPRILDVGTGSGVLAIAAARALHARVLATDIDAFAVRAARENARHNRAAGLVAVVQADGVGVRAIRARGPSI